MAEDPLLPFIEQVTEIGDELKEAYTEVDDLKASGNLTRSCPYQSGLPSLSSWVLDNILSGLNDACRLAHVTADGMFVCREKEQTPLIGGAILVANFFQLTLIIVPDVPLYFLYLYLIGYIDRGGSKAGSSGSLDFRDIYISIDLFQAAYVWIKFRDVIPRGAVYYRPNSNKFEPRIKLPVTKGVGGKSKRIPLGLYNSSAEGEVVYQIAAFYCKKLMHRLGRLDLGGGAYFSIPALSVDPNLPYEEKVKQVGVQVLKVYAEFEERKASRNLLPSVPGLPFGMPTGEGQLSATSPSQQFGQPLNSGMDLTMQGQGSQLGPNIRNGVDFNNPGCFLPVLAKTQHELLDAHKQIECLKARVARTNYENMRWEVKYSELERKYSELEQI